MRIRICKNNFSFFIRVAYRNGVRRLLSSLYLFTIFLFTFPKFHLSVVSPTSSPIRKFTIEYWDSFTKLFYDQTVFNDFHSQIVYSRFLCLLRRFFVVNSDFFILLRNFVHSPPFFFVRGCQLQYGKCLGTFSIQEMSNEILFY